MQFPNKLFSNAKVYVDPTTYNAVEDAVQDFTTEIKREDLNIGELLGGGEFAEVFKGTLYRNGLNKDVAIKTLKVFQICKLSKTLRDYKFLMREASSERDCLSVCMYVCMSVCPYVTLFYKFFP